ncbi:YbaB/EbfC family nucleoid-associated protein [Fodinicola acaciae]|uniref:YbaB/EbfC family nucleoid-associated protein n=1 Tax=Fodinicola acaciae TaxID=2681555 RepID=UPI0013D3BC5C|nr:YbaB/EbfC family nucleoid-associated protein [Fodinicola acaciae]
MTEPRHVSSAGAELADIAETAESADGLIQVTVGGRGELRSLWLDPRIYRLRDAAELAEEIRRTIASAVSAVRRRAYDLLKSGLPRDTTADTVDLYFDPVLSELDRITGSHRAESRSR